MKARLTSRSTSFCPPIATTSSLIPLTGAKPAISARRTIAVARLRGHYDSEQDRDGAREEQQGAIDPLERQRKGAGSAHDPNGDCVRADHVDQRERGHVRPKKDHHPHGNARDSGEGHQASAFLNPAHDRGAAAT